MNISPTLASAASNRDQKEAVPARVVRLAVPAAFSKQAHVAPAASSKQAHVAPAASSKQAHVPRPPGPELAWCVPASVRRLQALHHEIGAGGQKQLACKGALEASKFLSRVRVLGVIGSGRYGAVLRCTLNERTTFALKLEPMFRTAKLDTATRRLEESGHKNTTLREILTIALLSSVAVHERRMLDRAFSEMTLNIAHAFQWGTLRMAPNDLLSGIKGVAMDSDTRKFLSSSRTWSYMAMELASGGSFKELISYTRRLAAHPDPSVVERFVAAMYTQLTAQLSIVGAQHKVCHNDLHPGNICWMYEDPSRSVYYELPCGTRLLVPLSDTAPLGALSDTPCQHGALLFKIIDWGLASAETPYMQPDGTQITLCYGPTTSMGGEYTDTQFYHRLDYAKLLSTLDEHIAPQRLPPRVQQVLEYCRQQECELAMAMMAAHYPGATLTCNNAPVAPSKTPPLPGTRFFRGLFSLPLFQRYRVDAAPLTGNVIPARYVDISELPGHHALAYTSIQNETMSVEPQLASDMGNTYHAKLSARTL